MTVYAVNYTLYICVALYMLASYLLAVSSSKTNLLAIAKLLGFRWSPFKRGMQSEFIFMALHMWRYLTKLVATVMDLAKLKLSK